MILNDENSEWKVQYFKTYATQSDNEEALKSEENIKFEHFPPALGQYYSDDIPMEDFEKICDGKLHLIKSKKCEYYNPSIIDINYEKTIKTQLNMLMQEQMKKLHEEDPEFLTDDEKDEINKAEFPFIKLMTLVYTKDTKDMTEDEQNEWKAYMNQFITQQIVFGVVNMYFTMKLYQDNIYKTVFETPYNQEEVWDKYTKNQSGICVTYDFKEVSTQMLQRVQNLYPILYVPHVVKSDELDFKVYNLFCASMFKVDDEVTKYDKSWTYLFAHKYTNTEYMMLDSLLEPLYAQVMTDDKIQEILSENYLEITDGELNYNHKKLIEDLSTFLDSDKFHEKIDEKLTEVYNITPNQFDVDFMKPEAVYLGLNYPDDKVDEIKKICQDKQIRIFKIKKDDEKGLFKAILH